MSRAAASRAGRRWLGPVRGPVAVLFGPGPWDAFGLALARLGYRSLDLGDEGAEAALSAEGLREDLTLVGQGAGAVAATDLAARRPEAVARLVLIAPHGVVAPPAPAWTARLKAVPAPLRPLADRAARALAPPPARLMEAEHRLLGRQDVPVVALWGGRDEAVPLAGLGVLAAWNRNAKQEVIEGAGSDLLGAHGDRVAAALAGVLREGYAG